MFFLKSRYYDFNDTSLPDSTCISVIYYTWPQKMQNWSDAIQNNFTHQSLVSMLFCTCVCIYTNIMIQNIQLSSVKTLQLKEELDQAQYSVRTGILFTFPEE